MKLMQNTMIGAALAFWLGLVASTATADSAFGYKHELDIVYGQGTISPDGVSIERDLLLDVYLPSHEVDGSLRPAVVLVHGGAHLRGGRRQPPFREEGAVHSRMEDYARMLAPLGYVSFVIEYRLAQEMPVPKTQPGDPGLIPVEEAVSDLALERVNFARNSMGLPRIAPNERKQVWDAVIAGAEDTAKAINFIRQNAEQWSVDPNRIAVGGHSAGAGNTLNATFGLKSPVAAVFPMSPPTMIFSEEQVISGSGLPATLLIVSGNDIGVVLAGARRVIPFFRKVDLDFQFAWVPGFPHFYPSGAPTLADDGSKMSVGERITEFLDTHLKN